MMQSRKLRRISALLALVSVLFMQLAVAAYACPSLAIEQVVAAAQDDMQDCHGMDMEQPSLCEVHDQVANQSLDKPSSPDIQPFVPAALQLAITEAVIRPPTHHLLADNIFLTRATAPPHAIEHCCFRI